MMMQWSEWVFGLELETPRRRVGSPFWELKRCKASVRAIFPRTLLAGLAGISKQNRHSSKQLSLGLANVEECES